MATDFELAVLKELSDIKSIATTAASNTEALSARLFDGESSVVSNLQNDIKEIKDDRKSDQKWERVHNIAHYSLAPLLVAIHALARHLGMEI